MTGLTIITVSFNSEKTISRNIDSIRNICKELQDTNHIIIDGKSQDKTVKVINDNHHSDLSYISEPDDGIYDAMNKGVRNTDKEYVVFINSDDYIASPSDLVAAMKFLADHRDIDVAFCDVSMVDEKQNLVRKYHTSKWFKNWMLRIGVAPPHPGTIYRRSVIENENGFNPNFKISSDFEIALRLVDKYRTVLLGYNFTNMQIGGVSTRGFGSYFLSTKELSTALYKNGYYICWLTPLRFFVKLWNK